MAGSRQSRNQIRYKSYAGTRQLPIPNWSATLAVSSGMLPAYRPEHVCCRHLDTVALPTSIRDFVTLTGTDYKFTECGRIEASALLAPGGTSKYLLNGVDDKDTSGMPCARSPAPFWR